jgi:hypothetical protein
MSGTGCRLEGCAAVSAEEAAEGERCRSLADTASCASPAADSQAAYRWESACICADLNRSAPNIQESRPCRGPRNHLSHASGDNKPCSAKGSTQERRTAGAGASCRAASPDEAVCRSVQDSPSTLCPFTKEPLVRHLLDTSDYKAGLPRPETGPDRPRAGCEFSTCETHPVAPALPEAAAQARRQCGGWRGEREAAGGSVASTASSGNHRTQRYPCPANAEDTMRDAHITRAPLIWQVRPTNQMRLYESRSGLRK